MTFEPGEITVLIEQWQSGSPQARDQLIERLYPELKKIASAYLNSERSNHTLAATAVINELYLKFLESCPMGVQNRAHFFALAAQSIRHILVDYARRHRARKRGGNDLRISLGEVEAGFESPNEDLLSVHEALIQLQKLDARAAQVVELRFFGGLNEDEVAEVLSISRITVQRDWRSARAWLISRLASTRDSQKRS